MIQTPANSLAHIATAIGQPTRSAVLCELMDGRAHTATELAVRVDVAFSTASEHLSVLLDSGIVSVVCQGRHRYYRITDQRSAALLEVLMAEVAPAPQHQRMLEGDRYARTCYDHIAGYLGVVIRDALVDRGWLSEVNEESNVTALGGRELLRLGIDIEALSRGRWPLCRDCLDWSERRFHVAGALGSALLDHAVAHGWVERRVGDRTLRVTDVGAKGLKAALGIEL